METSVVKNVHHKQQDYIAAGSCKDYVSEKVWLRIFGITLDRSTLVFT